MMAKADTAAAASYLNNFIVGATGALTFNEWMMLGGLVFSALTFFVNLHYQRKRSKESGSKNNSKPHSYSSAYAPPPMAPTRRDRD